ncbi:MAG: baseplate J/gp47 family protein [Clostridium sp.]|nr:baseplate J/gp47 family protein [Clostridium sp.]
MQPEFTAPDFMQHNTAEEIHQRMMNSLPDDIDDMPGGFPFDFTMPAALEKDELINYHLMRTLMIAFPMYAWDDWLDLHGAQVHVYRHQAQHAAGCVLVSGITGAEIKAGTVFCTPATDNGPSLEFATTADAVIGDGGTVSVSIMAVAAGTGSNVAANTITIMARPDKAVAAVTNPDPLAGGTERESNDDFYDRIFAEYDNSMTFLGNDTDYIRWAKAAGAGDCIVDSAWNGPGTVKLILIDANGQPAGEELIETVYSYIVSPDDRSARLLPTACAELSCVPATTVRINYTITGLQFDTTTNIEQIKKDFAEAVRAIYSAAKSKNLLRYNDVRPVITAIAGVEDFSEFLIDGGKENIILKKEEYPETGTLDFQEGI